jgi:RsiW-degrading membrane proteinase PrsW (M82 family)
MPSWLRLFLAGLGLWVVSVVVTLMTANPNLVPTLVLLGSFLVPVTFVYWAFENWRDEHVTTERVITAFVAGGLLGVLGASLAETYLLGRSPMVYLGVGLIEEAAKLVALLYVTRNMRRRHTRDGILLGAAVGFGFAAFETAGYSLTAALTVEGLSLRELVQTEILRGLLAPVGHGLWTAILGGVLFRAGRYSWPVVFTYLWVSLLHALWNSVHGIATALTYLLTGTAWQYRLFEAGYVPRPTPAQVQLFTLLSIICMVVVALLGIGTYMALWNRAREEPEPRDEHASTRP